MTEDQKDAGQNLPVPVITEEAFDSIMQVGDFSKLSTQERSVFMYQFSKRMGLNPLTKPFDLIPLNGKLTIYANRTATDQLAQIHKLSTEIVEEETDDNHDTFTVKVKVKNPDGREDMNIGSVGIAGLTGEGMANAKMKAYTKAKRRAILAFTGLGFLDELEIESIQGKSEEAMAKRSPFAPTTSSSAPVVTVPAPESLPPKVPTAEPSPGKALPPIQPPTDVKK